MDADDDVDESGDAPLRVIVLGNSNVGKTSLVMRFANDDWPDRHMATVGVFFSTKRLVVDDRKVQLFIADTCGMEKYRGMSQSFYRDNDGAIVVYDVTDQESFEAVPFWMHEVNERCPPGIPRTLVGNKVDAEERVVSQAAGQACADANHSAYLDASAKLGLNVDVAFQKLASMVLEHRVVEQWVPPPVTTRVVAVADFGKQKNGRERPRRSRCRC